VAGLGCRNMKPRPLQSMSRRRNPIASQPKVLSRDAQRHRVIAFALWRSPSK
jgi:hypothetical protein